ncbi:MAG TPA: family 20 glycosylhydrolase, partial [Flavobacteriales bacterium]|nr:family 20 glycosylhydrolase [Flavobacteriales bacterium]
MRPILLAFALSLSALVSAQAPLVPWPRNVEWQEGDFALKQVGVIEGEGAQGWGAQLRKELSSSGATSIAADEILRSVQLIRDSTQGEEGYTIAMEKDVVRIAAGSRIGALHATRTLEQLAAPDSIGNWHWPRVRIQDAPAFAWRGTMLDVSRHFYSVAFIKQYLDELAALKMNVFHWHLTDDQGWRVEVKKFPKLTEVGAWRTEADGARYGGFY